MTYAQRQLEVKRAIRQVKRAERALDSAVERVERELERLLKRKTLIEPKSMTTFLKLWDGVRSTYKAIEGAIVDAGARIAT
jgi:hypothetical protein